MKVKIEKYLIKEGSMNGKAWKKISILSAGKWYNCFAAPWNQSWGERMEVEFDIEERKYVDKNGQQQTALNILSPKKAEEAKADAVLHEKLDRIWVGIETLLKRSGGNEPPDDTGNVPF